MTVLLKMKYVDIYYNDGNPKTCQKLLFHFSSMDIFYHVQTLLGITCTSAKISDSMKQSNHVEGLRLT